MAVRRKRRKGVAARKRSGRARMRKIWAKARKLVRSGKARSARAAFKKAAKLIAKKRKSTGSRKRKGTKRRARRLGPRGGRPRVARSRRRLGQRRLRRLGCGRGVVRGKAPKAPKGKKSGHIFKRKGRYWKIVGKGSRRHTVACPGHVRKGAGKGRARRRIGKARRRVGSLMKRAAAAVRAGRFRNMRSAMRGLARGKAGKRSAAGEAGRKGKKKATKAAKAKVQRARKKLEDAVAFGSEYEVRKARRNFQKAVRSMRGGTGGSGYRKGKNVRNRATGRLGWETEGGYPGKRTTKSGKGRRKKQKGLIDTLADMLP